VNVDVLARPNVRDEIGAPLVELGVDNETQPASRLSVPLVPDEVREILQVMTSRVRIVNEDVIAGASIP
jgi:hypothetical protein